MQTQLFETDPSNAQIKVLDTDGRVDYFPSIFESDRCAELFSALIDSLDWRVDQIYMFGKLVTTKRKVAWVGDAGCSYKYSGVKKNHNPGPLNCYTSKSARKNLAMEIQFLFAESVSRWRRRDGLA